MATDRDLCRSVRRLTSDGGELLHCDGWDPGQKSVATATPEALAAIVLFGPREQHAAVERTLHAALDRV